MWSNAILKQAFRPGK